MTNNLTDLVDVSFVAKLKNIYLKIRNNLIKYAQCINTDLNCIFVDI